MRSIDNGHLGLCETLTPTHQLTFDLQLNPCLHQDAFPVAVDAAGVGVRVGACGVPQDQAQVSRLQRVDAHLRPGSVELDLFLGDAVVVLVDVDLVAVAICPFHPGVARQANVGPAGQQDERLTGVRLDAFGVI